MLHSGDTVEKVKKAGNFLRVYILLGKIKSNSWLWNYDGEKCFGKIPAGLHPSFCCCSTKSLQTSLAPAEKVLQHPNLRSLVSHWPERNRLPVTNAKGKIHPSAHQRWFSSCQGRGYVCFCSPKEPEVFNCGRTMTTLITGDVLLNKQSRTKSMGMIQEQDHGHTYIIASSTLMILRVVPSWFF